ncbi:MAG TPA: nuclear transport factor 2 family protein [Longimicrobium sp.]|nr:nuclear transport factor 2 family protein [Longimicrobium sp.]
MHPNEQLLERLYTCLREHDADGMAACYHPDATFDDIAFSLAGRKKIHAMWDMICRTDIRAEFKVLHADNETGVVDLVDEYHYGRTDSDPGRPVHNAIRSTFGFRDGLIFAHEDRCDALVWGRQALGPALGVLTWLVPIARTIKAKKKLKPYLAAHQA